MGAVRHIGALTLALAVTAIVAFAAFYGFVHRPDGSGRALLKVPGAGPLWARYYEIGSDRPLFGDRDKSIHDDVSEISKERRNGYSWFNNGPAHALELYAKWAPEHPAK